MICGYEVSDDEKNWRGWLFQTSDDVAQWVCDNLQKKTKIAHLPRLNQVNSKTLSLMQ